MAHINFCSRYVVWAFGGQSPRTYFDSYFSTHFCSVSTRFDEVYYAVDRSNWLRVGKAYFVQCWRFRPRVYRGHHHERRNFFGTSPGWGWSQGCNRSGNRSTGAGVDGKSPYVHFQWRYAYTLGLLQTLVYGYSAVEIAIGNSNIQNKAAAYQTYLSAVSGKSNSAARSVAADILGEQVYWDWDGILFVIGL